MSSVTIRDLRNRSGEVVARVMAGESVTITRAGTPVAELQPVPRRGLDRVTLLGRWRHLPKIDPQRLRDDLDLLLDPCCDDGTSLLGPARHRYSDPAASSD